MPLNEKDWQSVYGAIRDGQMPSEVVYGVVTKRDTRRKLIWMAAEFGSQPIPLVGFNATVKIYDTNASGATVVKTAKIIHEVPQIGEVAVVLRQLGTRRLTKCVGVILSHGGFVT